MHKFASFLNRNILGPIEGGFSRFKDKFDTAFFAFSL